MNKSYKRSKFQSVLLLIIGGILILNAIFFPFDNKVWLFYIQLIIGGGAIFVSWSELTNFFITFNDSTIEIKHFILSNVKTINKSEVKSLEHLGGYRYRIVLKNENYILHLRLSKTDLEDFIETFNTWLNGN